MQQQMILRYFVFSLLFLSAASPMCLAQNEPEFEELTRTLKKKYFSIGILFQAVADFQPERSFPGKNGFSIANMRINLSGELDNGFGYLVKTNIANSPAILDAKAYYAASGAFIIDLGLFKPPFSKEYLTGAGAIDFVNRSQAVTALAASRQIGVQIRGVSENGIVSYGAGVFNGNAFNGNTNDDNNFMYAGRVAFTPALSQESEATGLEIGVNAAYSNDQAARIGAGVLPAPFSGKRLLLGGDVRFTSDRWLISTEAIGAVLNDRTGMENKPFGYQATAGYMVGENTQMLLRWDSFRPDMASVTDQHLAIVGFNLWPTKATELQVNYIIPTENATAKNHQLLLNGQFAF